MFTDVDIILISVLLKIHIRSIRKNRPNETVLKAPDTPPSPPPPPPKNLSINVNITFPLIFLDQ